jgi:hypothetical protein
MTTRSNLVSLDQRRRAQRALHFFADILGGGRMKEVAGLNPPLPEVHHLPRLKMDIAVTRDPAPAHLKAILEFARRRQVGFLLVRYRDPALKIAEAEIAAILFDGGLAVLDRLWPATDNGHNWTLAGPRTGDVHLRVTQDGLVPTLTEPWLQEDDRESFVSKADAIFAEYLWRD